MLGHLPTVGPRPKTVPEGSMHFNSVDLSGKRFGKLLVIKEYGRNAKRSITWVCLCDCGNTTVRVGSTLIAGKSTSCGCNTRSKESRIRQSIAQRKPGAVIRQVYGGYRAGAVQRDLEFSLSFEQFSTLIKQPCYYCGCAPKQVRRTKYETCFINGIDRLDNSVGYIESNCVSCCKVCNLMKHTTSVSEFLAQCNRIVDHQEVLYSSKIEGAA